MGKRMRFYSILFFVFSFAFASVLFSEISASSVIRKIYSALKVSYVENRSVTLKNGLRQYFLIDKMSKRAIRDYWNSLKEQQKKEYTNLMGKIFEITIFEDTAENISKGTFKILHSEKLYNGNYKVYTTIDVPSEDIVVQNDFKLEKDHNVWKIYDVYIDGASIVEDYRSQFNRIIEQYGLEDGDNSFFPRLRKAAAQSLTVKFSRKDRKKQRERTPSLLK